MEIATVIFLIIWMTAFCLIAYRQLDKEFKPYLRGRKGEDK